MNPRRSLHGKIKVLLGLCYSKPIKAHKQHLGGGNFYTIFFENIELCLFVKFSDLGIGEVSGTHPPASSRLCFQVIKRRRTKERGLGQQDNTRRIITSPYNYQSVIYSS